MAKLASKNQAEAKRSEASVAVTLYFKMADTREGKRSIQEQGRRAGRQLLQKAGFPDSWPNLKSVERLSLYYVSSLHSMAARPSPHSRLVYEGDGTRPAGRRAADLYGKATHRKSIGRQGVEVMKFF